MSRPKNKNTVHRVNVNFHGGAYSALQELAAVKNKNMTETLRDSITLAKWMMDTIQDGGTILVEKDGVIREVIFP